MASIPGAAGPGAGYPQWAYNTLTKTVGQVNSPAAKVGLLATTFPAKIIFFTSEAAADAYMTSQGGGVDLSKTPIDAAANAVGSAAQTIAGTTGASVAACAVSVPLIGCVLTKTQARALIGGALIAGGAIIGAVGLLLLALEGFRSTGAAGALNRTGSVLSKVPGPTRAAGTALRGAAGPARAVPGVKPRQEPSGTPAAAAPAAQPKRRVGGSQVSEDFAGQYMKGAPSG